MLFRSYECLKKGEKPEICYLTAAAYNIPENYWQYIILSLITEEYVKGITVNNTKDGILFGDLPDAIITPKGISYLLENSLIEKSQTDIERCKRYDTVYLEKPLIIMIGGIFILILAQGGNRIARYEC